MKSKLQLFLITILALIALVVAIPTVSFTYKEKSYEITNANPTDLNLQLIQDSFSYKPALDIQGGSKVVYDVDLKTFEGDKVQKFKQVEETIARRMGLIGLRDFEFTSFYNLEDEVFQLHLTTPEELETTLVQVLSSPGNLDVLVDDPEAPQDPEAETASITDGRKSSGITNDDILSMSVISDSRIYSGDPETPNNFGLEIVFKPEAKQKLQLALLSNISTGTPLIFSLDGSFVALQASGYYMDPYQDHDRILLYTTLVDSKLNNAVLGAVMSSPSLDTVVVANPAVGVNPTYGSDSLQNAKLITIALVGFMTLLTVVILRKKSLYVIMASFIFAVVNIALHKILNLNLSLSLIFATQLIVTIFILEQIITVLRVNKFENKSKLLEEYIESNTLRGWRPIFNVLILVPLIIFFENLLTASVNQFIQVIIMGVLVWQIYKIVFFVPIFKLFMRPIKSAKK
ncbi:MAG TPA: hypothetical protein PK863_01210 [Candidatus Dojkabacteria bacterium]|nr:hypothetical protein [Candidatus Dojkabacteria bacterium]HRP50919.1 hypothetical protein [Candidatus Dojkabacteria bacterium]